MMKTSRIIRSFSYKKQMEIQEAPSLQIHKILQKENLGKSMKFFGRRQDELLAIDISQFHTAESVKKSSEIP
jgi:hypothetical protein